MAGLPHGTAVKKGRANAPALEAEGCPLWEMSYLLSIEMCKQFRLERRRPRNYARHGLTKRVLLEHAGSRDVETCLTETQGQALHRVSRKTN